MYIVHWHIHNYLHCLLACYMRLTISLIKAFEKKIAPCSLRLTHFRRVAIHEWITEPCSIGVLQRIVMFYSVGKFTLYFVKFGHQF